jgi:hypothetical protein
MDTKLTLKLDQEVIEKAKLYASERNMSLSRIVEFYLKSLTSESETSGPEISEFVRSMASGIKIPQDYDYKSEYTHHVIRKHT